MADVIYSLCALTAILCMCMLLHAYRRTRYRLLLWGGLCFAGLTINNIMLVTDKVIVQSEDLGTWRMLAALAGMLVLLYGLIWDNE